MRTGKSMASMVDHYHIAINKTWISNTTQFILVLMMFLFKLVIFNHKFANSLPKLSGHKLHISSQLSPGGYYGCLQPDLSILAGLPRTLRPKAQCGAPGGRVTSQ